MRKRLLSLAFPALFLTAPAAAFAHHLPPGMEEIDEFADHASFLTGFNHPLTGIDHLLAALVTGWLASRFTGVGRGFLPAAAVSALLAGALAGHAGFGLPATHALLIAAVGGCVALSTQSPRGLRAGAAFLVLVQFWHGSSHLQAVSAAPAYLLGMGTAAALLMIMGLALAILVERRMPVSTRAVQPA